MQLTPSQLQEMLSEYCPELHPRIIHTDFGLQVLCEWALRFTPDPRYTKEHCMDEIYSAVLHHIGKMTELAYTLRMRRKKLEQE